MKKNTDKSTLNDFNFEAIEEKTESMVTRLGRLWATAAEMYRPNTDLQRQMEGMKLEPYSQYTYATAIVEFNKLAREYEKVKTSTRYFEDTLRVSDVDVHIDHMNVNGTDVVPVAGTLEKLTAIEATSRDCSNILVLYTEYQEVGEKVMNIMDSKHCEELGMPILDLTAVRKFLKVPEPEFSKARERLYNKLSDPANECVLIYTVHEIYKHSSLADFRQENVKLLAYYNKKRLKGMPALKVAYEVRQGGFSLKTATVPDKIWRAYCKSQNIRGGSRKKGVLSVGYYRYDMPSFYVETIEEATDVFSIIGSYSFRAVTLVKADVMLAKILTYNNVTVYCPSMTVDVEKDQKRVGVYARGKRKSFKYSALVQVNPTLSKHGVTLPNAIILTTNELTVYVSYLPSKDPEDMRILPSCRAANGLCLLTNIGMKDDRIKRVPLPALYQRFSSALAYRNWFVFSRVTFVAADPYQNFFTYGFTYPKIKPEVIEDLYDYSAHVEVQAKALELRYYEVQESELAKPVPNEVPKKEDCETKIQVIVADLSDQDLEVEANSYNKNRVPLDEDLLQQFALMDQESYHDIFQKIVQVRLFDASSLAADYSEPEEDQEGQDEIGASMNDLFDSVRKVKVKKPD